MLRNLSSSDLLNVCCRNRLLKDEVRLFQLKAKDNKHSSSTCNLPIFDFTCVQKKNGYAMGGFLMQWWISKRVVRKGTCA